MPAPTDIRVRLQRPHAAQQRINAEADEARKRGARFFVVRCGRRWGKTTQGKNHAVRDSLDGKRHGWFAPNYKYLDEPWADIRRSLDLPGLTLRADDSRRRVELATAGVVDAWTCDGGDPGRGRAYHRITVDEAALISDLESVWERSIRPTLADYGGEAWFYSTPRGLDYFNTLYERGQSRDDPEWMSWHMETATNPYIPAEEIEAARAEASRTGRMAAFMQEWLALPLAPEGLVLGLDDDGVARYEPRRNVQPPRVAWRDCKWRIVGIDPGGTDPTAIVLLGVDREDRHHVYYQESRKGTIDPITLHERLSDWNKRAPIDAIVIDTAFAAGQLGTVMSTLSRMGWPMYPANPHNDLGIPHLQMLFKSGRLTFPPEYQDAFQDEIYTWMHAPRKPGALAGNTWATMVTVSRHHADRLKALQYACVAVLDGYPAAASGSGRVVSSAALWGSGRIVSAGGRR